MIARLAYPKKIGGSVLLLLVFRDPFGAAIATRRPRARTDPPRTRAAATHAFDAGSASGRVAIER